MKIAVFATLVASAAAFAPSKEAIKTSALKAYEGELGAQEPVGDCTELESLLRNSD